MKSLHILVLAAVFFFSEILAAEPDEECRRSKFRNVQVDGKPYESKHAMYAAPPNSEPIQIIRLPSKSATPASTTTTSSTPASTSTSTVVVPPSPTTITTSTTTITTSTTTSTTSTTTPPPVVVPPGSRPDFLSTIKGIVPDVLHIIPDATVQFTLGSNSAPPVGGTLISRNDLKNQPIAVSWPVFPGTFYSLIYLVVGRPEGPYCIWLIANILNTDLRSGQALFGYENPKFGAAAEPGISLVCIIYQQSKQASNVKNPPTRKNFNPDKYIIENRFSNPKVIAATAFL